jgi:hypothetical protein
VARGWESKDVEAQLEARQSAGAAAAAARARAGEPDPEARARYVRREKLLLQRTRILSEMQSTCNPRFRGQLDAELAWLDAELAKLPA